MSKRYTEADVRAALRRYVAKHGYEQAMYDFGYSQYGIDCMISGRLPIHEHDAKCLRFTRHVEIYYTREDDECPDTE